MPSYYKLVEGTIEIDGVRMHQTARKKPWQDSEDKVKALNPNKNSKTLDICTGLGYTAIIEANKGCHVTTIEKDPNVLNIIKENPQSQKLFNNPSIKIINADAFQEIKKMKNDSFDYEMHDPPRFSFAGELYSQEFYKELFRVLKNKGRLFHYLGNPKGNTLKKGVKNRLEQAGFTKIKWIEDCKGYLASKNSMEEENELKAITSYTIKISGKTKKRTKSGKNNGNTKTLKTQRELKP